MQKWQGLGMELRGVRELWYQGFGLRTDSVAEVRKREKGQEKRTGFQTFIFRNPCG